MGSPEKPLDLELGDMSDETKQLNPDVKTDAELKAETSEEDVRFTGLTKEELMKISSKPQWVRARWALFIIFWLVWVGMLVGAILIVVKAPRCKPEPSNEWYQDTVVYEVNAKDFAGGYKGMEAKLDYIQSLKSKTILLTGAASKTDQKVVDGNKVDLSGLVNNTHKQEMKIMVDLKVATLATNNTYFKSSSQASCVSGTGTAGSLCDFFIWSDSDATPEPGVAWVMNADRNQYYKTNADDSMAAYINYNSPTAKEYLSDLFKVWFDLGMDGVQLSDFSQIKSSMAPSDFLQDIWATNFAEKSVSRALFVYASGAGVVALPQTTNLTNESPAPVVVHTQLVNPVGKENAGKMIESNINAWRAASISTGANTASPLGGALAAKRVGHYAAGLNVLAVALPGVPIIRSGDEMGYTSSVFNWTQKNKPEGGSKTTFKAIEAITEKKAEGIQTMQSIRFDTRNNDTIFRFIDTGNGDVLALYRKWATKTGVLVVSNMSPNNHTINLVSDSGLVDKNSKAAENAKVEVTSSTKDYKDGVKLEKFEIFSGDTYVLSTK